MENLFYYDRSSNQLNDTPIICDWRFRALTMAMFEVDVFGLGECQQSSNRVTLYYGTNEKDLSKVFPETDLGGRIQPISSDIDDALAGMFLFVQTDMLRAVDVEIVISEELANRLHTNTLLRRPPSPKDFRLDEALKWLTGHLAEGIWFDDEKVVISGCLETVNFPESGLDTSIYVVKMTSV